MGRKKAPRSAPSHVETKSASTVKSPKASAKRKDKKRNLLQKLSADAKQKIRDVEDGRLQVESLLSALERVDTAAAGAVKKKQAERRVTSRKGRSHVLKREVTSMATVLADEGYKANPFATLLNYAKANAPVQPSARDSEEEDPTDPNADLSRDH